MLDEYCSNIIGLNDLNLCLYYIFFVDFCILNFVIGCFCCYIYDGFVINFLY